MMTKEEAKERERRAAGICITCSIVCLFCMAMYSGWLAIGLVFYTAASLASDVAQDAHDALNDKNEQPENE